MRTLRILMVLGFIGLVGPSVRASNPPCKLATKGDSSVAKACKEGGFDAAKKEMRRLTDKVKEKTGNKPKCEVCHDGVGDDRYDVLKKDGRAQFDKMLLTLKK